MRHLTGETNAPYPAPLSPAERQALAFQAVVRAALRHGTDSSQVGEALRVQLVGLADLDLPGLLGSLPR